jgi:hypothetical protein
MADCESSLRFAFLTSFRSNQCGSDNKLSLCEVCSGRRALWQWLLAYSSSYSFISRRTTQFVKGSQLFVSTRRQALESTIDLSVAHKNFLMSYSSVSGFCDVLCYLLGHEASVLCYSSWADQQWILSSLHWVRQYVHIEIQFVLGLIINKIK